MNRTTEPNTSPQAGDRRIHVLLDCVGDPLPLLMRRGISRSEITVTPDAGTMSTDRIRTLVQGATAVLSPLTVTIDEAFQSKRSEDLLVE